MLGVDTETVIGSISAEQWTADPGTPVELANDDLVMNKVAIYDSNGAVRVGYDVDYSAGTITADPKGTLTAGTTYSVKYEHYKSRTKPCSWDDSDPWTAKDVSIPSGVPTHDVDN